MKTAQPFEMKSFGFKVIDSGERTFSGLGNTWDLDTGGDVVPKGAFKGTINNWRQSQKAMPLVDSHQWQTSVRSVVGKMLEMEETDQGLMVKAEIIDGPDGDEIYRRVKGGYVDQMSIGYNAISVAYPKTEKEREQGVRRYLNEIKLNEVSLVVLAMNEGSRIDLASVKSVITQFEESAGDPSEDDLAEMKRLHNVLSELLVDRDALANERKTALADKVDRILANRLGDKIEELLHSRV